MRGEDVMRGVALCALFAAMPILVAVAGSTDHWVDQFGTESVVLENARSILILKGQYVAPPYEIERRGLAIYVNDLNFGWDRSESWPPDAPLGSVLADPGPPPEGAMPFATAKGYEYWQRKQTWILKTQPYSQSVRALFEVMKKAASKDPRWTVRWSEEDAPQSPIVIALTEETDEMPGWRTEWEMHLSTRPPSEWVKPEPMTKERMIEDMRSTIERIARELSGYTIIYKCAGCDIRTGIFDHYLTSLEVLMRSPDLETAKETLEDLDGLDPSKVEDIGLIEASPQLEVRIASLRAEMEAVGAHSMAEVEQKRNREKKP
jgi:hypothetical protein